MWRMILVLAFCCLPGWAFAYEASEHDFVLKDFKFGTGERLPALRLHYTTLGLPKRDAKGNIVNAVMILHGTVGTGRTFLRPQFADVLFAPDGLLDSQRFFIVLPDSIGHGKSSKPSDGLKSKFPHYDYDDMVEAQYRLLTEGLGIKHLRLLMGTSMGCMHSFIWGEAHPDFMSALMPLACLPVQIAGRNRVYRKMIIDAIVKDPDFKGGEYTQEPRSGLRAAADLMIISGSAPLDMQKAYPARDDADKFVESIDAHFSDEFDANELVRDFDASRNYDPSARLEAIKAPLTWINSADDFVNPPELGIAEAMAARIKSGHFVLLPIGPNTHGHGTYSWPIVWQDHLKELLARSE